MTGKHKIKYIQERLGSKATERDAKLVLEALEDAEVVVRGKYYLRQNWEQEVRDVDFTAVLEDVKHGREAEIRMRDRLGWVRSYVGVPSALEVLAQRLEREGYSVVFVDGGGDA